MYEHLDAIEDVTLGIVRVEGFLARHLGIGMVILHLVIVHDDGEGTPHDFLVYHGHDLSLRENLYQLLNLLVGPEHIAPVRIDAGEGLGQLVVIFYLQITNLHLVNLQ